MTFNSIKILALALALLAGVACGKNKNNLNIDGKYQEASLDESEDTVATKGLTLVEIENGLSTTYKFTADKKSVEISKDSLIVKGSQLIGSETVEDLCEKPEADGGTLMLKKTKSNLMVLDADANVVRVLKSISKDEFKALTQDLKEAKVEQVCLSANGKVVKKINGATAIDIIEEEKAKEEKETVLDTSNALTSTHDPLETSAEDSI